MADTQYRGLSGTGGRAVLITNGWDLAQNSVAQQLAEAHDPDVLVDHVRAPEVVVVYEQEGSAADPPDRVRRFGGEARCESGNRVSGWVNLDRIEAEAAKLVKRDPNQAARFYGNIPAMGNGAWLQDGQYAARVVVRERPVSGPVCLGFDGSDVDDWSAIRLETLDGYQFTPVDALGGRRVWNPRMYPERRIPRLEVMAAFDHIFETYDVVRCYMDPPLWMSEVSALQGKYGEPVVIEWPTYRVKAMFEALERFKTDLLNPDSR
jgi:hypothetical protein